jgi:hypothetical protein
MDFVKVGIGALIVGGAYLLLTSKKDTSPIVGGGGNEGLSLPSLDNIFGQDSPSSGVGGNFLDAIKESLGSTSTKKDAAAYGKSNYPQGGNLARDYASYLNQSAFGGLPVFASEGNRVYASPYVSNLPYAGSALQSGLEQQSIRDNVGIASALQGGIFVSNIGNSSGGTTASPQISTPLPKKTAASSPYGVSNVSGGTTTFSFTPYTPAPLYTPVPKK